MFDRASGFSSDGSTASAKDISRFVSIVNHLY